MRQVEETPMHRRTLGSSGLEIAPLALGGWLTFGGSVPEPESHRILAAAVDGGMNFVDLADVYADGEAERVVGRFLRERRPRDLLVSSKVFWPTSEDPADRGLGRAHVTRSIERTLRNLGVEVLDLYFCHREDPATPLEETVQVMSELVRAGRIRAWGTSCWRPATLQRAHRIAGHGGGIPPAVEQPQFSLLCRWGERDLPPVLGRLGMGAVVFSPLAGGVLSGKYLGGRPEGSRGARSRWNDEFIAPPQLDRVRRFVALAAELGLAPATLALAWVIRQPWVGAAITGATSVAQVETNLEAARCVLTDEVAATLDRIFPRGDRGLLPRLLGRARRLLGRVR
jgi:aryl-alcohol dehydrogenase-like predicted oxidoreductase